MHVALSYLKSIFKSLSNVHNPSDSQNFFLFTMPRSGSTWLMELLCSQPGFKYCNEPLYIKNPLVSYYLGINDWDDLYEWKKEKVIYNYFQRISEGKLGFLNPNPFGSYYRPFTNRIVFKVIHGGEDRINWFRDHFNGKVIYLIRHPIAVSISRKNLPRLETLIESQYGNNLSVQQKIYARNLLKKGNHLEKGVLSWCLQNLIPIRDKQDDWAFITYEQMVVNPNIVLQYLQSKLELVNIEKIKANLGNPSMVKYLSNEETIKILKNNKRSDLITKWRKKISKPEERKLWEIIEIFNIDIYNYDQYLPNNKYLIK